MKISGRCIETGLGDLVIVADLMLGRGYARSGTSNSIVKLDKDAGIAKWRVKQHVKHAGHDRGMAETSFRGIHRIERSSKGKLDAQYREHFNMLLEIDIFSRF